LYTTIKNKEKIFSLFLLIIYRQNIRKYIL
jgi:hypothetical protein